MKVKILWDKTIYQRREAFSDEGELVRINSYGKYVVKGFNSDDPDYTLSFFKDELIVSDQDLIIDHK